MDGSGQSTQAALLKNWLKARGKKVLLTKEPTKGPIGRIIRAALKKKFHAGPLSLQLLFVADRGQHLAHMVEPALKQGKIVISDRYALSTIAYGSLGADKNFLKMINSKFRVPDVTILLDVPPEVCVKRIKASRPDTELFEEVPKLRRVRRNYLALRKYWSHIFVVNGKRSKEKVAADVQKIVARFL